MSERQLLINIQTRMNPMITTDKVNQIFCIIYDFSKNLAELSYMDLDFAAKIV